MHQHQDEGRAATDTACRREMLKQHDLRQGDTVSVEVDTNNDAITIGKPGEPTGDAGRASSR